MIKVDQDFIPVQTRFANQYNLQLVLNELGNPEKLIPTINVVGTNGKGSTACYLSQGLQQTYQKVGLFLSPAFLYQNERIQVNDQMISDADLKSYLKRIDSFIAQYHLTFFEIWTLMMILYFVDQKVDLAVVEAGIGGVKDATHVLTNQLLVLLTGVSLDHTEILGNSIGEILDQKLGIAQVSSLVLISADNQKYETEINQICRARNLTFRWTETLDDAIDYQKANKGLALTALNILGVPNDAQFNWKTPLGRFTILRNQPKLILDGAHNLDGIQKLIQTLKSQNLDPVILYASSQKKDWSAMLELLNQNFTKVYVTKFKHFKAWDYSTVQSNKKVKYWKKFLWENKKRDLVICGSLYFIPQVYEWYQKTKRGEKNER